jgi:cytochrome c oxidase assembly protein subunit 15
MAVWLGLILTQALLGAATVWSNKAADVATAHVLLGAVSLVWGIVLSLGLLSSRGARRVQVRPVGQGAPKLRGAPGLAGASTSAT